jgi:L,D-transpeptidase YcbB
MPGVRLNGFLVSTAVALLLAGAAGSGGAVAQSANPAGDTMAVNAPDSAGTAPAAGAQSGGSIATALPADDPATPPAAATGSASAPAAATDSVDPADAGSASAPAAATDSVDPADAGSASAPAAATDSIDPAAAAAAAAAAAKAPQSPGTPAPSAASPSQGTGNVASPAAPAQQTGSATPAAAPAAATPAATASAPVAAPVLTIDEQIAEQLRQLSSGKFDRLLGGKAERESIAAFYSGRSYAPIWITDGKVNSRAKAAVDYLARVGADGLDPADYPVPDFKSLTDPQALAEAELKFSISVLTYARHASIGRVAWSRVDANIEYDTKAPDPASVLAAIAGAQDVAAALDGYEPHAPGYLALKAKLAEIRGGNSSGLKPPIPNGRVLKVGDKDDRVPALREKLGVAGGDDTVYDKTLAEAVKAFQKEHGLKPTGTLTAPTVAALNGPRPTHVVDTILANMERWRWMPHDLGKNYVLINLPDFTASVFHDGKRIWKTKIVIGKPDMPTPIMTAMMKFITINPIWHVPPSIINREYLPAMAEDPTVMQRMGLVVERDNSGKVIGIYQPPGDKNAEGRIRFNFPNKFLVYQHDTPDKYMFASARRAFSHGCMRTQDPAKYAEVLLSLVRPKDGYTEARIKSMYGPNEINIDFPTFIPIHITYQTAFVDDSGKLVLRDDIYGRDRELLAILHSPAEMRVADISVEHQISASHREILSAADGAPTWGRGQGGGPVGFFQQLFGGGFGAQQPPPRPGARRRVSRSYSHQASGWNAQ